MTYKTSASKTVVFVTLAYAPIIGGAERQTQILLEQWAREGREVWVLTRRLRGSPREERIHGVRVVRLWSFWWPVVSWMTFTGSVLLFLFPRRREIETLWSPMFNAASLAAAVAGKWFGIPVMIRISASGPGGNLQVMRRSWMGSFFAGFQLKTARNLIALNTETVKDLQKDGVPFNKIKRIPNGVDGAAFQPADEDRRHLLRQKLNLTESQVATLFVGRLDEQKNVRNLLVIWDILVGQNPESRLLFVGEGPLGQSLKQWVLEHRRESSVGFLGLREDILDIYQACDLFILPSYYEGLSNALLEAMACGLPPIVSQIPGNVDVVQKDQNGIWVDPCDPASWAEPWQRLLSDRALRKRLGQEARRHVLEDFSVDAVFRAYQSLEASLLAGNSE